MRGTVSFVGAGPGAVDLLTLRGAQRIADADLVLYTPGATDAAWLREHTAAELLDCSRLSPEEIAEHYRRVASRRGKAVRLVSGDPAMAPRLREQLDLCARLGLDVEVVPGVSPVSAAAPVPLLEAGSVESLAVTTIETDFSAVRDLAAAGRALAVRAPAARTADLVEALRSAGIADDTPAVVADKPSRPDETLVRTTVGELVAEVKKHNLWRSALFLVGESLRTTGKAKQPGEESAPRWTARSWRRPTDEPRKTWAERRAEAGTTTVTTTGTTSGTAAVTTAGTAGAPGAEAVREVEDDPRVPVTVGAPGSAEETPATPKPVRPPGKRSPRSAAKRAAKKA
jgi:precorrin-4/cobalt-precorrin-4 C11-methyltransferase